MAGTLGFSYVGLVFLMMLFVPNLLWARSKPQGYSPAEESRALRLCERTGEALTCACALIFSDFNLRPWSPWCWWLAAAFALMALYDMWWVRYFRSSRTLLDFYSSFFGVPLAGATLPVLAFFLLGIYGRVALMLAAALLLGIGHIGIHHQHQKKLVR